MTVTIDSTGMAQAVAEYFVEVIDNAAQALVLDWSDNGPRSDEAHEHMVDLIEITAFDNEPPVLSRTFRSPADYSSFVDEGTEPHKIEGNPFLAFTLADGTRVVVRSVQHPGTPRTGWWTDRLNNWSDYLAAAR